MSISADFREEPHRFVAQLNRNPFCLLIPFSLSVFGREGIPKKHKGTISSVCHYWTRGLPNLR